MDSGLTRFDLKKTQQLAELCAIPPERRNAEWQKAFYTVVPGAGMRALDPQVITGPDGFSYFALAFPTTGQEFESFSVEHILDFCLGHGFGIVILEPPSKEPCWVFRYGDLSSYQTYGQFEGDPEDDALAAPLEPLCHLGSPSNHMLPLAARTHIKTFLKREARVKDPAVALMVNTTLTPRRSLIFNVYRDQFQKGEDYDHVMHQLLWFLPQTRGVIEATPALIQPGQFHRL